MFDLQPVQKPVEIKGFHSIYYFEFSKDFSHAPEQHDFCELVYVDNGKAIAIADGKRFELQQGQAIFHEPNASHAHVSDKNIPNNMLVITFTAKGECLHSLKNQIFTLGHTEKTLLSLFINEAKNALGSIPNSYGDTSNLNFSESAFGSTQLMQCYLTELLIHFVRNAYCIQQKNRKMRNFTDGSLVKRAIYYMEENLYRQVTLDDICAFCMCGNSSLNKIFRKSVGQSPMNYYADLKMKEAKKLLRTESLSVSEIADLLGYTTIHNFSRAFKKSTGFSPTAYVKSIL